MKKILLILTITLSTPSYSQLTDSNFLTAVRECLSTNPVDGLCTDSDYGIMPDWDVSQVTDMTDAFSNDESFNADISNWDVSNVRFMNRMFFRAFDFNQPLNTWDTGNVVNMKSMFGVRYYHGNNSPINFPREMSFNQNIGNWDVSNVITMRNMLSGLKDFNQDISNWDVSRVNDMSWMFGKSFNQICDGLWISCNHCLYDMDCSLKIH